MFRCPVCGWRESPCWRASPYVMYATYSTLDELMFCEPKLYKQLKDLRKGERRRLGDYVYWLRGSAPHIYRILADLEGFASGNQTEKPKNRHGYNINITGF